MTEEFIYSLINFGVMPAWALLVFAPRSALTRTVVHSGFYPIVYGIFYSIFLANALFFGQSTPGAGMSTIAGVMAIFSSPNGVLTGWTHYLVFDLFVGAWIGRDARRRGTPHWLVAPCLLFCLMFGPIGLLLYLSARFITGKGGASLDETPSTD